MILIVLPSPALSSPPAMLQADDEDDLMEERMKSPFGSSFRTFNATDYKPIGKRGGADLDCFVPFDDVIFIEKQRTYGNICDQSPRIP